MTAVAILGCAVLRQDCWVLIGAACALWHLLPE
jgi:hypothetical protein